jgi:hypothetical protein
LAKLANASVKANFEATKRTTERLRRLVDQAGSAHRIKGKGGQPVTLSAKADTKGFSNSAGKVVVRGAVRGVPEGFWSIVEYGSGKHLMTARGGRITRSGRAVAGRYTKTQTLKKFGEGHSFSDLKPLSAGRGSGFVAQWVMHPGHGSQGKPWERAMSITAPEAANIHRTTVNQHLVQTWAD